MRQRLKATVSQTVVFLRAFFIFLFLVAPYCWAVDDAPTSTAEDNQLSQKLSEGAQLAASGRQLEAISRFDDVIAVYEERYRDERAKLFSARWSTESLMYLLQAANEKTNAKVVSLNWAYGYYLKTYSLIELGRMGEAREQLGKAITLSPRNSQFLSELGEIYSREKNWPKALETFKAAESAAQATSPPEDKNGDLSRAWRGLGYVYIEQNKFDQAENMYQQCLKLNSTDQKALNELRFIQQQREKLSAQ